MHAKYGGGELTTRPLVFKGRELILNFSTAAAGSIRESFRARGEQAVREFALSDCPKIYGDAIEDVVKLKAGSDVSESAGRTVRLRFVMKDAVQYAIRFRE